MARKKNTTQSKVGKELCDHKLDLPLHNLAVTTKLGDSEHEME